MEQNFLLLLKDWRGRKYGVRLPEGTKEVHGVTILGNDVLVSPVYATTTDHNKPLEENEYAEIEARKIKPFSVWCKVLVNGRWLSREVFEEKISTNMSAERSGV